MALVFSIAAMGCHKEPPVDPAGASTQAAGPGSARVAAQNPPPMLRTGLPDIPPPQDLARPPAAARRSLSGLATLVLSPGSGSVHPRDIDRVSFRFVGWTKDGKVFALSGADPTSAPKMDRVYSVPIRGLAEGLKLMVVGEKRRMWIPAELGYKKGARGEAEAEGDLVMDVELLDVPPSPAPPPAPPDAAGPGAGAHKTKSGLAYRIFASRRASAPRADTSSMAVMNYTAWNAAGKVVASTISDAVPASVPVADLDAQWAEAVSLLHKGDKIRFWFDDVSAAAAPGGGPARQVLVAEVELLDVYPLR